MFTARIAPRRLCRRALATAGITFSTAVAAQGGTPISVRIGPITAADSNLSLAVRETLATDLAKSDRLTVLGGSKAGAAYTLTGSCLFLDDRVVINVRMVNAAGNTVPGAAANVEGPREEVLGLVHSVAERFAARLSGAKVTVAKAPSRRTESRPVRLASLGNVPIPATKPAFREPFSEVVEAPIEAVDRPEPASRYTGVIVDARGLNLERSMSPRIRRLDGTTVYDGGDCTPDFAIEKGVVVYARSMEAARGQSRAGANPLIIQAADRYNIPLSGDPLITDEDAEFLGRCARRDGFFKKYNVVFLID